MTMLEVREMPEVTVRSFRHRDENKFFELLKIVSNHSKRIKVTHWSSWTISHPDPFSTSKSGGKIEAEYLQLQRT